MQLTSTQNPMLQKLRRAVETGRALENGDLAAEGPHLLQEALESAWRVSHVFCSTEARARHEELLQRASRRNIELTEVADRAFRALSGTEHTQGILSLMKPKAYAWPDLTRQTGPIVILDAIQDPGNAGAIIRSAEAFSAAGVVFTAGCVRVSNGKLLRAASGSLFRVPFLENQERGEITRQLRVAHRLLFALAAGGSTAIVNASFERPFALAVGSEGAGVSPLLLNAGEHLSIPTKGVESLNAAVACSITLYEAARQRQT